VRGLGARFIHPQPDVTMAEAGALAAQPYLFRPPELGAQMQPVRELHALFRDKSGKSILTAVSDDDGHTWPSHLRYNTADSPQILCVVTMGCVFSVCIASYTKTRPASSTCGMYGAGLPPAKCDHLALPGCHTARLWSRCLRRMRSSHTVA
jgi:hypothetical protein